MNNIQVVVFDMAGTTVRDTGSIAIAFIEAFKKYGYEVNNEEVNRFMGFRKKEAIRMLLEKFDNVQFEELDETVEKIHTAFLDNMISFYKADQELQPLPNAEEVFSLLRQRGIKVALNTGFTRSITDTILKKLNWDNSDKIDFVIASDEVPNGRPHPFMIQTIMRALNIDDPKYVAKVGDTEVDVWEGRIAGCGLVASVTTGAFTREQLEEYQPDYIIDNLSELTALIK